MKKSLYIFIAFSMFATTAPAYGWIGSIVSNVATRLSNIIIGSHRVADDSSQTYFKQSLETTRAAIARTANLQNKEDKTSEDKKAIIDAQNTLYNFNRDLYRALHELDKDPKTEKEFCAQAREVMESPEAQFLQKQENGSIITKSYKNGIAYNLCRNAALRENAAHEELKEFEFVNNGNVAEKRRSLEIQNKTFKGKVLAHKERVQAASKVTPEAPKAKAFEWVFVKSPRYEQARNMFDHLRSRIEYNQIADFYYIQDDNTPAA